MARDYARIEQAIGYLEAHHTEQPRLSELAQAVGLSELHLQRLFHRWAGVTPKSFLQFVTPGHAKRLLGESRALLGSSLEVGLSGPSRLHDLFVTVEAMTPGEYRAQGAGVTLRWGFHDTPFGEGLFVASDRGLCGVSFVEPLSRANVLEDLRGRWPRAGWAEAPYATRRYAHELTARVQGQPSGPLSLVLEGTPLQLKVWEALLRIPEGAVVSYEALSKAVGRPRGARAVGTAVGANPIGYLIPCHRVIRSTGAFGEYHWGSLRKQAMLGLEQARRSG
jgi:AraC family transcriptional regulator of adaptative response/methylated-DNA-[protein]-cysteine methyltransferase